MSLFSFLTRPGLKPRWQFSVDAVLWRLIVGGEGKIVGEVRDPGKKTASFFCLDLASGRPLWQGLQLEEPWWVGIETIYRDVVFLHGFEKPSLPGHRQIYAIEAATGRELWRNLHLSFWFAYQDRLFASEQRFEKRVGYALSLREGTILGTYEDGIEELFPLRQLAIREEVPEVRFPEPLQSDWLKANLPPSLFRALEKEKIVNPLEGIVTEEYLLMHYYKPMPGATPEAIRLQNVLWIVDLERRKLVFTEVLQKEASAPLADSFFLKDATVFFVRDQRTLFALDLKDK